MVRQEKVAWFSLIVVTLAIATYCILMSALGFQRAFGAFGILGLLGLQPAFALFQSNTGVQYDERDATIQGKAVRISYALFWIVFVAASVSLYFHYQNRGEVPVQVLPMFPMVGWIVLTLTQSIVTLTQYARGR